MSVIKRQTIIGTFYSYLGVGIGMLTQALIMPIFFSAREYGLQSVMLSYTLIIAQFASLGYNQAGTRFFSNFRNAGQKHNGYLFTGLLFSAIGFGLGCILLYAFKDTILTSSEADRELFGRYFHLLVPLSLSTMLFYLFDNYAKGLYDTVHGNFYKEFLQRFLIFLAACLVAFKLADFNLFIGLWTVAICLPTVFMAYRAYQLGNFSITPDFSFFRSSFKREFLQFSAFSVATGFSSIIITHLDKLMVNGYLGLGSAGIYGFSLLFGNAMTISYNIAAKAATAIVLDAMEVKEYSKIESIYKKSGITQLVLGCFMLLLVWVNVDELLSFIKPEFAAAKWPLIIIGLGKLFELANGINTLILAYSRYYKLDSLLIATFIVVLYVLNQLLIPTYAINGAAVAAVASIIYYNSFRTYLIQRFFGINPFSLGQLKVLALGAVILLLGLQLPVLGESFIARAGSIVYRSALTGGLFVGGIYWLRVSADIDSVFSKVLSFLKIKQ